MPLSPVRLFVWRLTAIALIVLQATPAPAADPPKITVVPGTPNVWSMEQAHYLLNRLRANKDGLQTKKPSEDELDPNAINGLRLDVLQSFLGVAAGFDQIGGTQNKVALDSYRTATSRRNGLQALSDARLAQAEAVDLEVIQLTEQQDLLTARKTRATDPELVKALDAQAAVLAARLKAATSLAGVLRAQVTALNEAAAGTTDSTGGSPSGATGPTGPTGPTEAAGGAGTAPALGALTTPSADYSQPLKDKEILKTTFDTLIKSKASSFGQPRMHASQILDNFVDMQYEIVAKQLTTLRDEVGKGQRVVFLELPTSISAGAHRKMPFVTGGEDGLAQSWWRLKTLYLAFDRENSPCWADGEDIYDSVQTALGFKQGHDVAEVPKGERLRTPPTAQQIQDAAREADREFQQLQTLVDELGSARQALRRAQAEYDDAVLKRHDAETLIATLKAKLDENEARVKALSSPPPRKSAGPLAGSQSMMSQEARRDQQAAVASSTEEVSIHLNAVAPGLAPLAAHERQAGERLEQARKALDERQNAVRLKEIEILRKQTPVEPQADYYMPETRARIQALEQPCRQAQVNLMNQKKKFDEAERALSVERANSGNLDEKLLAGKRATAKMDEHVNDAKKRRDLEQAAVSSLETTLRKAQATLDSLRSQKNSNRAAIERQEKAVAAARQQLDDRQASLRALTADLVAAQTRLQLARSEQAALEAERDALKRKSRELEEEQKRLRQVENAKLRDQLEFHQVRIYREFGGVQGIHHAFRMAIKPRDSGIVRTIEMFPRQTALNVNSTHALSNTTAVSLGMKYLFGLGAKVDYQRMREKYDQFVQQEVFASGFGKGGTEFGWTFGPNPGTRVLNPGLRTTYAALAVPSNATGLELETVGCSFHHNSPGPRFFSEEWSSSDGQCKDLKSMLIGLPDRDSSGSFWVDEIRYAPVNPGERATVVLRGQFSPETNVLVNGKRLTQVVGLGKPSVNMDFGGAEDQGTDVIWGTYEYVNEHYMTLLLNVPAGFKAAKFPTITLISPSRTATLNQLPLSINGRFFETLDSQPLLIEKKPNFALTELTVIDVADAPGTSAKHVTARLSGNRLSKLDRLWINGRDIDRKEIVSDTLALIDFDDPGTLRWCITAASNGASVEVRSTQTLTMANPVKLMISGVKVDHVEYKKDVPSKVDLIISGTAFRPDLQFPKPNGVTAVVSHSFVTPEQWIATVSVTTAAAEIIVALRDGDVEPVRFGPIAIPKKAAAPPEDPEPKGKTTVTEVQKTVTEKK